MNNFSDYISIHADIRFGKPCIKNTRIAVNDILSWLASGMSHEEILKDYPLLKRRTYSGSFSLCSQQGIYH